ncbi:MAG: hypothetical protein WB809_04050 [Thermoplasmata archaeon]
MANVGAEGTFNLATEEVAHYKTRARLRFSGTLGGVLFLLIATFSAWLGATEVAVSQQQIVDFLLAAFFGIGGAILLVFAIRSGIPRGPHRLHLTLEGLTFDFPEGRQLTLDWQTGPPFKLVDYRTSKGGPVMGYAAQLSWRMREFGLSGEACDSVLAAARGHGVAVVRYNPWFLEPPGTTGYRVEVRDSK